MESYPVPRSSYTHVIPQLWITRFPLFAANYRGVATEIPTDVDNYSHKLGISSKEQRDGCPQLFHPCLWMGSLPEQHLGCVWGNDHTQSYPRLWITLCGEVLCLWVSLFKTLRLFRRSSRQKRTPRTLSGEFSNVALCAYRQRVVIRKPTIATPKPTRILPAPRAGTG